MTRAAAKNAKKTRELAEPVVAPAVLSPVEPWWRHPAAISAGLMLCVLIAYIPALRAGYVWDDRDHLPSTNLERSLTGLYFIWFKLGATPQYYPLTHTTFWIESNLWGLRPFGYHLINVLLHGANAALLWRVLRRLEVPGALLAALIFALHPVHVESVAWVSERKNCLSGLFYLSAMLTYLRFVERENWLTYAGAIVLFACALFSKTVTSTLPAALVLILWWKRKLDRRQFLILLPMFAMSLAMGRITAGMEQWNIGAVGRHWDWSFAKRCLIAGRALWFYAGKLVWPHPLIFTYPRWNVDELQAWQYAFPLAVALVVIALWFLRNRVGRGPLVAVLLFCGTLFPALGFVAVYPMRFSYVADHFQYLASASLIALLVATLVRAIGRASMPVVTAGACLFAVLTFLQARIYKDPETIWRETARRNDSAWIAHTNLGAALESRGDDAGAAAEYARSLEIEPDQVHTHLALGAMCQRQGDVAGAEAHFRAAQQIEPEDVRPPYQLARIAAARQDFAAAESLYRKTLELDARFERARLDLAALMLAQGRTADAMTQYQSALEQNPYSVEARLRAGSVLFKTGQVGDAIRLYSEAEDLGDESPTTMNGLGAMYMQTGQTALAVEQFRRAVARQPNFAEAHYNLGNALQARGDTAGAAMEFREALRLKPDFAAASQALQRLGR
jgi:tetratricopeptide (TPR) repeat protein